MKKTLLPLLVAANTLIPVNAVAQNFQKSREEIAWSLSLDGNQSKINEKKRRQEHLQRLVSQIKEPIIL